MDIDCFSLKLFPVDLLYVFEVHFPCIQLCYLMVSQPTYDSTISKSRWELSVLKNEIEVEYCSYLLGNILIKTIPS